MTTGPAPELDHETVVARVRAALAALTEGLDPDANDMEVVGAIAERLIEAGVTDAMPGGSDCPLAKYLRAELAPEEVWAWVATDHVEVKFNGGESEVELSPALRAFVWAFDGNGGCNCSICRSAWQEVDASPGLTALFRTLRGEEPGAEDGEVSE